MTMTLMINACQNLNQTAAVVVDADVDAVAVNAATMTTMTLSALMDTPTTRIMTDVKDLLSSSVQLQRLKLKTFVSVRYELAVGMLSNQ